MLQDASAYLVPRPSGTGASLLWLRCAMRLTFPGNGCPSEVLAGAAEPILLKLFWGCKANVVNGASNMAAESAPPAVGG